MNAHRFRLIFSKSLGMLVPVAEQTPSRRKSAGGTSSTPRQASRSGVFLLNALALGIAAVVSAPTFALPTAPTVVGGSASFTQNGNTLTVTNSNGAMIQWQSFNVGANEVTRFVQPSASSSVLNHVTGNNPSAIYGQISSNGQVWLINPAGILVGPGAVIDTAGFVASTLTVRAEDFLAGRLNFQATPGAQAVINQGSITTPAGGSVVLVGTHVSNEGIITTPNGETILAAGNTVSLIDTGTPGVKVEITGDANNATNLGQIVAEAGRIGIAGSLVKNSGTLDASSVVNEGGRIFLKASQDTYVDGNGRIVATGTKGGQVEVLGERVAVMDNAEIDASGANGGGTILVGGDYQGKNPDVQNAQITYFGPDATLKANATDNGDGGKVIVWADDTTRAFGSIEAKGTGGGAGGFVETSGKRFLDVDGIRVNTQGGTWLLDPTDVVIVNDSYNASESGSFYGGVFTTSTSNFSYLRWGSIVSNLTYGDVVITTGSYGGTATYGGSIAVLHSPGYYDVSITHTDPWGTWTNTYYGAGYNSNHSLSLLAHKAVNINAWFGNTGTGAINVLAGWDGNLTNPPAASSYASGLNINIGGSSGDGGIATLGPVNLKAVDSIVIQPASNGSGIDMGGSGEALNIEANKLSLTAGDATYAGAFIRTNGDQNIRVGLANASGGLFLQGGDGTGVYGAGAQIMAYAGNQSIEVGNGATIGLYGGSGSGLAPAGEWSGECSIGNVCSGNNASIENYDSGQPIVFTQSIAFTSGGNLQLHGGSVGSTNSARIESVGPQSITGNPVILLQGGTSGGTSAIIDGDIRLFENEAGISTEAGNQTIQAASITLVGGSATYGGVFIGTDSGSTSISTTGDVSLTGGSTSSGSWDNPATPAFIGSELGSVTLTVGGTLSLTAGAGSPAAIGVLDAAGSTTISAGSGINLTTSANSATIGIGSPGFWGYSPNLGDIGITPNASVSSTGGIAIDAWGSIRVGGTLNSAGTISLLAGNGNTSGLNFIDIEGKLTANNITATASGNIWAYTLSADTISLTSSRGGEIHADTASSGSISATIESTSSESYSYIGIYNTGNPSRVSLVNSNSVATHSGVWFGNGGDLSLNGSSQFSSASGGYMGIWSSGQLSLSNLSLETTASASGYGDLRLAGYNGIQLSGVTLRNTASGSLIPETYTYTDEFGNTVTEPYSWNQNGISLHTYGNITLAQGTKIEAPNADVLFSLWGDASELHVGNAGDANPSYVLSKATTTYIEMPDRTMAGGIFIDGVETTTSRIGGSGFFAGSLSTPAVPGAGLSIQMPSLPTSTPDSATDSANQVIGALSDAVGDSSSPDETEELALLVPAGETLDTALPGSLQDPAMTTGGEADTFGAASPEETLAESGPGPSPASSAPPQEERAESGKEEGKDKKEAKQEEKTEKKEDKPASKKLATCK